MKTTIINSMIISAIFTLLSSSTILANDRIVINSLNKSILSSLFADNPYKVLSTVNSLPKLYRRHAIDQSKPSRKDKKIYSMKAVPKNKHKKWRKALSGEKQCRGIHHLPKSKKKKR